MTDEPREIELLGANELTDEKADALMDNFEDFEIQDPRGAVLGFVISISRDDRESPLMGMVTGLTARARELLLTPDGCTVNCEVYRDYKGAGPKLRRAWLFEKPRVEPEQPDAAFEAAAKAAGWQPTALPDHGCIASGCSARRTWTHPPTNADGMYAACTPCLRTHLLEQEKQRHPLIMADAVPLGRVGFVHEDGTVTVKIGEPEPKLIGIDFATGPDETCWSVIGADGKVIAQAKTREEAERMVRAMQADATKTDREKQSLRLWRRYQKRQLEWVRCGHIGTDLCIHHRRVIVAHANACSFDGIEQNEATIELLQATTDQKRPPQPPARLRKPDGWNRRFAL